MNIFYAIVSVTDCDTIYIMFEGLLKQGHHIYLSSIKHDIVV